MNNLPIETYESVVQQRDALEKKLADVVAENAELKKFGDTLFEMSKSLNGAGVGIQGNYEVACQQIGIDAAIDAFDEIETPATDAFINSLMGKSVEALQIPESFKIIGENIRTQDNRATSHPLFAVMQKREIVVDGDYDHDRIIWWHSDGYEASETKRRRLELLHDDFRDTGEWRRLAVKEINEFVTACFTEQGCKDYLNANGHNLRHPFIYVFSAYRNAEFIAVREWLAKLINDAQ